MRGEDEEEARVPMPSILVEDEDAVLCPGDGVAFDLRSGEPVEGPGVDPVPVFPVRVDEQGWVEVGRPAGGGW